MADDVGSAVLAALVEAVTGKKVVKWENIDTGVDYAGKKIILPNDPEKMPLPVAMQALKRVMADEEQETNVHEVIEAHPLEGAVAFFAAMKELYGVVSPVSQPGFFGPRLPELLSVQVDVDEWVQVPWGAFKIPGVENNITMHADRDSKGRLHLVVAGTVRKKERHILIELAAKCREILKENSIYKGKAIHIDTDEDGDLDLNNPPTFVDLRGVHEEELILNRDVEDQVKVNILTPMTHTAACRAAKPKIPLKRGILLEGPYGIGKTMLASVCAKTAVANGWTYITISRSASLREALLFAQRYQPAVVFCEDIDRSTSTRDESANDLLNIIGGILTPKNEVMVVLTTNHVEKIEQAMLRPGRLDAVISIGLPDAESVARLIRIYARNTLAANEPLNQIGEELQGWTPAVIREVVDRSKLAMIAGDRSQLIEDDLLVSVRGMKNHLDLLKPKVVELSLNERFGGTFRELFEDVLTGGSGIHAEGSDAAEGIKQSVGQVYSLLRRGLIDLNTQQKEAVANAKSAVKTAASMKDKVDDTHRIVRDNLDNN